MAKGMAIQVFDRECDRWHWHFASAIRGEHCDRHSRYQPERAARKTNEEPSLARRVSSGAGAALNNSAKSKRTEANPPDFTAARVPGRAVCMWSKSWRADSKITTLFFLLPPQRHAMRPNRSLWPLFGVLILLSAVLSALQDQGAAAPPSTELSTLPGTTPIAPFGYPIELVEFVPSADNPVFRAGEPGQWDQKIRERGWILREDDGYHLWYTGYDGTKTDTRLLGYATSPDGLHWTRWPDNPLVRDHWVEDMMVVKQGDTYYMFAEGLHDQAQLLTSKDRVHWNLEGTLDVRQTNHEPIPPGPYGTPTAWLENGVWYLFYERADRGVWLATSRHEGLDERARRTALPARTRRIRQADDRAQPGDQVSRRVLWLLSRNRQRPGEKQIWTTGVGALHNLVHWEKYPGNPIVPGDKSSGFVVFDGQRYRLYTAHNQVDVYFPRGK